LINKLLNNIEGTNFQIQVWTEISKIPFGKTKTYKEIAISLGKPNSARAVANACGKNPYPIDIPCHRVIRSDGNIGGYSAAGGEKKKLELLKAENFKFLTFKSDFLNLIVSGVTSTNSSSLINSKH
jgi:methylated-DNA-[protein]-cysteine S-methyltransferase